MQVHEQKASGSLIQIQPFLGEEQITTSNVEVRVSATDRDRALALVQLAKGITYVTDEGSFEEARQVAGQLKAMLDEIETSRKQAKTPFTAVGRTIDDVARKVADPVLAEHKRVLAQLNGYVAKLEAARKEQERREAEEKKRLQAEANRRVQEAELAKAKAEEALRLATDEIETAKFKLIAQQRENALLQEQLRRELQADLDELEPQEPQPSLVPGGRVDHVYDFELVNVQATCDARCYRLLRWELDIMACRDAVKNLVEMLPPDQEPILPGIKITKRLSVSVKASSRIK